MRSCYHLNRCLTFPGAARLALRDEGTPLSPWNLRTAADRKSATGPLVSVLVTTFNSADFVEGSLRSLLEQSYRDLEIVVCDDASADSTVDIVRRISASDPRIRLITNKRNVGTYASKNAAFCRAGANWSPVMIPTIGRTRRRSSCRWIPSWLAPDGSAAARCG
jgi:GT2 family glycosyltransferase